MTDWRLDVCIYPGVPTFRWRGCPYIPFVKLSPRLRIKLRDKWNPAGRQGIWRSIENLTDHARKSIRK
jgi:hypothetical protein